MKELINHIFITHEAQLSVFPEFISFLKGRKKIIRIVLDHTDIPFNAPLFMKNGFYVKESILFSSKQKNSFGSLVSSIPESESSEFLKVRMFSFSKSKKELLDFEYAEIYGDVEKAGIYLGYPRCCTKNITQINELSDMWATFYLNDYHNMDQHASLYTNRFPITWGGISIVGELFPCSLSCANAKEYALNMLNDLNDFGFNKTSKLILTHAKSTIYINKLNGSISKNELLGYQPIIFS